MLRVVFPLRSAALRAAPAAKGAAAPAKKKKDAAKGPVIPDTINIYAKGKDPQIMPDDQYPPWLFELLKPNKTLEDHLWTILKGEPIDYKTCKTIIGLMRRRMIKTNNSMTASE
eukprot:GILI01024842.1.p1 GENE.GILI01024842.1~~GILI01024842.1.p1  ORF type:complete len:134 (+),score=25.46 GILI01024842.1:63-404(+)